jgi:hypothetical protein
MMEIKITKPKLASKLLVKTAVWVRKPGPIAEVAIRKAAAMMGVAENFLRDEKNLFILWVE